MHITYVVYQNPESINGARLLKPQLKLHADSLIFARLPTQHWRLSCSEAAQWRVYIQERNSQLRLSR